MAEKKIKGRKRHISVDTQGNLLHVEVHAANIHDTMKGGEIFKKTLEKYPTLNGVCLDAGYRGTAENYVRDILKKTANISSRIVEKWAIIPVRWVVERTFGWLNASRRLSKDYEISFSSEETFIKISHSNMLLKRLLKKS